MQWALIPERLFLNSGCKIRILDIMTKTTDRKSYDNDVEDETKREKRTNNEFGYANTKLYMGVTFNITKNIDLQAALGVDSNNSINVFSSNIAFPPGDDRASGGLFNLANILLTLRF